MGFHRCNRGCFAVFFDEPGVSLKPGGARQAGESWGEPRDAREPGVFVAEMGQAIRGESCPVQRFYHERIAYPVNVYSLLSGKWPLSSLIYLEMVILSIVM